ncbi:DUF6274 family protein [Streptomyces sp. TRM49041]|uniref:DUF6274 family protein n=1 Tax=Streptomyces sp. TRM49041 TaxID=2603216 RepID=UPI0011EDFD3C|nr:DUF6274 family protein [Streptomyces sp. TRM49041]
MAAATARHETRALLRAHLAAAAGYRHLTRRCAVCHRLAQLAELTEHTELTQLAEHAELAELTQLAEHPSPAHPATGAEWPTEPCPEGC